MNTTSRTVSFGPYALDLRSGELRKFGIRVKIGEQAFQILELLLDKPGQMVTREELRSKLWAENTFVDFDHGLNSAVQRLRDCLSDSAANPRWIETIPRRGYRFIGQVQWSDEGWSPVPGASVEDFGGVAGKEARSQVTEASQKGVWGRAWPGPATMAVGAVALTGVVLLAFWGSHFTRRGVSTKPIEIHALAVLPLENLSADPTQEYFADGMTDELITMLAKNPGLRVISRTSAMQYKKVHRALPDIARTLGVDGILEGSVKRSQERVHINVQLVHAPTDTHLWAESYDRNLSDVGSLQSELAQTIAKQIGLTISPPAATPRRIRPEAQDAYMLGRYYWYTAKDRNEVRAMFQKAIDLQPDYAAAWSGLADSYLSDAVGGHARPADAVPQGDAAARKALALDDSLPEAHNSMAAAYLCNWNLQGAERESLRAIQLNPNFAEGHHLRGYVLQTLNRLDEALKEQKEATTLDPFSRPWALSRELIRARQYDAALSEARLRSQAQPDNSALRYMLAEAYFYKGMEKDAAREYEASYDLLGDKASAAAVRRAFQRGGIKAVYEWGLSDMHKKAARQYVSPLAFADAYANLKRKEETLHYLEEAYKDRAPWLVRIQNNPDFDFVRSDPRYEAIVKKMGLPQ